MLRRDTRKFLTQEYCRYNDSLRELRRCRERMSMEQKIGKCSAADVTYLIARCWWLERVTQAIKLCYQDMDQDERSIAELKFRKKNKLTDAEIISRLPLEKTAYYDKLKKILTKLGLKLGMEV